MGSKLFDQISTLLDLTSYAEDLGLEDVEHFTSTSSSPIFHITPNSNPCCPVTTKEPVLNRPKTPRRRRGRQACLSCRERKVRCNLADGTPCANCRWHCVKCIVSPHLRGRTHTRGQIPSYPHRQDYQSWDISACDYWSPTSFPSLVYHTVQSEDGEINEPCDASGNHSDRLEMDLPPFIRPFPPNTSLADLHYLQLKGAISLPPPAIQDVLIDAYIQHVQPRFHLISVTDLCRMANRREEAVPALSLLLYHAVLYSAAAFVDVQFLHNAGYASRRVARKHLYDKTRLLYNFGYEKDRLVVVQSLLLLAGWYQKPDEQKDSWYWVGVAISTAQSIGLNNIETYSEEPNNPRAILGRRVWWACLMHDRLIALGLRYPSRLKRDDYNIEMLEKCDFESDMLTRRNHIAQNIHLKKYFNCLPQLASICIARAGLCVLIGEILHEQYYILPCHENARDTTRRSIILSPRKKLDNFDLVDFLHLELCAWMKNLPDGCRSKGTGTPFVGTEDTPATLQRILLHMEFNTAISALFRPCITSVLDGNIHISTQKQKSCHVLIRDAAMKVTRSLTDLERSHLYRYMPSTGVSIALSAAVIHLVDLAGFHSFNYGEALACFQTCIDVLNHLREIYIEADYASSHLNNLFKGLLGDKMPSRDNFKTTSSLY